MRRTSATDASWTCRRESRACRSTSRPDAESGSSCGLRVRFFRAGIAAQDLHGLAEFADPFQCPIDAAIRPVAEKINEVEILPRPVRAGSRFDSAELDFRVFELRKNFV